jgi:CheY-like chemotaxis protein
MDPHGPEEQDRIAIANRAEELMLRTRQVARRIQDRIWRTMEAAPLSGPHAVAPPAVLIAEDESIIRDLLQLMLEGLGFQVWLAADGQEAVDLYRQHRGRIAATVLDLHMPRLDGPATLRALRALDPQVGCVFMTGHPGAYDEEALLTQGAAAVLRKPFTPDDLHTVLRPLLNRLRPSGPADSRAPEGPG